MISVRVISKGCGNTLAVNDLSFDVLPGAVTGFLGRMAGKFGGDGAPTPTSVNPGFGFALMAIYSAVALTFGAVFLSRRDA